MKELLKAISILQFIAFLALVHIDYSPFAVMFLRNIYDLTTYKIIPPEIMNNFVEFFIKKKKSEQKKRVLEELTQEQLDDELNREGEGVVKQDGDFLKNLNVMLFGGVLFVLVLLFVIIGTIIIQLEPRLLQHFDFQRIPNNLVIYFSKGVTSGHGFDHRVGRCFYFLVFNLESII